MKNIFLIFVIVALCFSCEEIKKYIPEELTEGEIIEGLKSALTVGAKNSSDMASAENGFYGNALIRIPWPAEANAMKELLTDMPTALSLALQLTGIDLQEQVTAFERTMNRAAEEASKGAFEVFKTAVTEMTIQNAVDILYSNGNDTAATQYLRTTTSPTLKSLFLPVVENAVKTTNVTALWEPLADTYNTAYEMTNEYPLLFGGIKLAAPVNPKLEEYITGKAINGLMLLVADEEIKIRTDPAARVNDILKKVFGKEK